MMRIRLVSIISIVSFCCSKNSLRKGYIERGSFFTLGLSQVDHFYTTHKLRDIGLNEKEENLH